MNKKGVEYSLFLVVVVIILAFSMIVDLNSKFQKYQERIGTTQFQLMQAYENAEEVQYYMDTSYREAFSQEMHDGAKTGFVYSTKCTAEDYYYGYKIVNTRNKNCFPSSIHQIVMDRTEDSLTEYFDVYTSGGIPDIGYDYKVSTDKNTYIEAQPFIGLTLEINPLMRAKCCVASFRYSSTPYYFIAENCDEYPDDLPVKYVVRSVKETEKEKCINKFTPILNEDDLRKRLPPDDDDDEPSLPPVGGDWLGWPIKASDRRITCYYLQGGACYNRYDGGGHHGLDFGGNNLKVLASGNGIVEYASGAQNNIGGTQWYGYGNVIKIKHNIQGKTLYTVYAHLGDMYVNQGQEIKMGEVIALTDSTGLVFGAHLHFEVRDRQGLWGQHVDPMLYIKE